MLKKKIKIKVIRFFWSTFSVRFFIIFKGLIKNIKNKNKVPTLLYQHVWNIVIINSNYIYVLYTFLQKISQQVNWSYKIYY